MSWSNLFWAGFFLVILEFCRWAIISSERICEDIKKRLKELGLKEKK